MMVREAEEEEKKIFGKRADEYLNSLSVRTQFITIANNREKTLPSKHEEVFTRSHFFSTLLRFALLFALLALHYCRRCRSTMIKSEEPTRALSRNVDNRICL